METHPECTLCFHNATIIDKDGKVIKKSFLPKSELFAKYYKAYDSKYSAEEMIKLDFIPSNSIVVRFIRFEQYKSFYEMRRRVCEDLLIRLFFSSIGYSYYINEVMSVYRRGVENSATSIIYSSQYNVIHNYNGHFEILDDFNYITEGRYQPTVEYVKKLKLFEYYCSIKALRIFDDNDFKKMFKQIKLRDRVSFLIKRHLPIVHKVLKKIRL